ncbi:MAG TPA: carbohydrate ABC transporter permease [Clostridiales bacterium]|nr:carbohydrate ABC transporter permease [Clostridiales bacterium]
MKRKTSGLNNQTMSSKLFDIFNILLMLFICFVTLYPFLYVLATSMSSNIAVMQNKVTFYPVELNFTAYKKILKDPYLVSSYYNTIKYTLIGTFINLLFTSTIAYPLSRKNLVFKGFFNTMIIITMFFGGGLIPTFLLVNALGMYDTIWAIVIPGAISTYYLIVMRTFFQSIPVELEESAKIDGASEVRVYFQIILPLSKAALAAIGLFYAVGHWNSFFSALIYLKSKAKMPLQILLRNMLISSEMAQQNKIASRDEEVVVAETIKSAAIIVTVIPIICVYPFLQKYFVKGVMIGSIKG